MMPDSLGDRMKLYERAQMAVMPMRMPVILRVDGKNFHAATRGLERPFDHEFMRLMDETAIRLCEQAQGAVFAYVQSDEISVLLHNYKRLNSGSWFDNEVQKIVSVGAGIASSYLTEAWKPVVFDARAFVIPEAEVCNYFIWRQQDTTRNSVQMAARAVYSHKQVYGKNNGEMQDMLHEKGINWNDYPIGCKRGRGVIREPFFVPDHEGGKVERHRWVSEDPPIFTQDREYVERHLAWDDEGASDK